VTDLSRIRLLVTDVDGVLTDGTVYVDADGSEWCRYSKRDGVLLPAMREAGIEVVALTGEQSWAHHARLSKLGIPLHVCAPPEKLAMLRAIVAASAAARAKRGESFALTMENVAYIGDDLPDLPCLEAVGRGFVPSGSPAHRVYDARAYPSAFVTAVGVVTAGGTGCLRATCAEILRAHGYDVDAWPVARRDDA
jgi:YrbI family 3-deoxy-D-manno-octulosonate 8-phosphate phosphatase